MGKGDSNSQDSRTGCTKWWRPPFRAVDWPGGSQRLVRRSVMTLEPPATVTGRVVRQKLPAPGVKVRFVPAIYRVAQQQRPGGASHVRREHRPGRALHAPTAAGTVGRRPVHRARRRIDPNDASGVVEAERGRIGRRRVAGTHRRRNQGRRSRLQDDRDRTCRRAGARRRAWTRDVVDLSVRLARTRPVVSGCRMLGQHVSIQPPAIEVKSTRSPPSFDVHVVVADLDRPPQ